jgi:hypothetical protein
VLAASEPRAFACDFVPNSTVLVCRDPGEFYVAAAMVGAKIGIQSFETFPVGQSGSRLFGNLLVAAVGSEGGSLLVTENTRGRRVSASASYSVSVFPASGNAGGVSSISGRAIGLEFSTSGNDETWVRLNSEAVRASPGFIGFVSPNSVPLFMTIDNLVIGQVITIDNVVYDGGPPSDPNNPFPPTDCPEGALTGFCFPTPPGGGWYDPPTTDGYRFTALGAKFTSIDDFPPGFAAPFTVSVNGVSLGQFGPGEHVDFPGGVPQFSLTGITPAVDGSSPLAFPIKLSVDTVGAIFNMQPLTDDAVDTTPPQVACQESDGLWHASNVRIACTASDSGSGLANAADGSFILATNVPAGTETANAESNQHAVCDVAGNCGTVGPIAGNKVDTKAPVITISAPSNTRYLVNQRVAAVYSCSDGGAGVASCLGPVANGGAVPTAAPGNLSFTVNAADAVGNRSSRGVGYSVTYGVRSLYDQAHAFKSGSTVPIKVQLVDVNGADMSSSRVVVTATNLVMLSTNVTGTPADAGNANPDSDFRFDPTLGPTGGYIFNLQTKGLATGVYAVDFTVTGDSTPHQVQFQVK